MRSWRPCSGPAMAVSGVPGGSFGTFSTEISFFVVVVPLPCYSLGLILKERVEGKVKPAQQTLRQRAALRLLLG